jgi:tight adherence protein B
VARVTTIAIALFGTGVSAWLARAPRRFAVIDRVRRSEPARLPRGVRIRLARMLDAAAIDHSPEQVVQLWLLSAFVAGVVGVALGMAIGCGAVITVVGGGPIALHAMRHRRARAVTAAVPETLERVAAELRAGGTVASAIAWLAVDGGSLTGDFARVQSRVELGAPIPVALTSWAEERTAAGTSSAAGALAVAHDVGGRAADALDSLAASLRDRLAVVAETHALSAQARYSALVVGLGPLAYLGFSVVVDRRAADALFGTAAGRSCALAGIALELLGAWWMRRILASGEPT